VVQQQVQQQPQPSQLRGCWLVGMTWAGMRSSWTMRSCSQRRTGSGQQQVCVRVRACVWGAGEYRVGLASIVCGAVCVLHSLQGRG
jgi:hypothetical protein